MGYDNGGMSERDANNLYMRNLQGSQQRLRQEITELRELIIWMAGCGYDFTQHEYFCEQRDKLLKS